MPTNVAPVATRQISTHCSIEALPRSVVWPIDRMEGVRVRKAEVASRGPSGVDDALTRT